MEKTTQVALFAAQAIAAQAIAATGAEAAAVALHVCEATGSHPAKLVYSVEMLKTGDTFEFGCSETTLEELTEKVAEFVAYSWDVKDEDDVRNH